MARTVILIDDDQDDLDFMKETIREIDNTILRISFIYPEEALRVVAKELIFIPNYIFTDINMPRMTGDKLIIEFRKVEEIQNTVITVLSTSLKPSVAEVLKRSGANHAFEKPFKLEDYRFLISKIIND